jgi:hypothetical protein
MYQIAIKDPAVYLDGEAYAKANHSTLEEMVNKYVASLADRVRTKSSRTSVAFSQSEEFLNALALVKTKAAKGGKPVPADEKGLEALADAKYSL